MCEEERPGMWPASILLVKQCSVPKPAGLESSRGSPSTLEAIHALHEPRLPRDILDPPRLGLTYRGTPDSS